MSEQHLALYRKYRPQTFDEVVGQEQIVTLLRNTITQKKIGHAYLFCGGRGTGKTTVARIFARDIGCNPEDIIEIDAASNRGIDEIRELREAVRTAPFSSPYKVYIVDEAHMLTKEAANALLKTLEEPPSHVIFILATTDPDKLPETIVSRCQKVVFKQPDIETLTKRLIYVAQQEGTELDKESAVIIADNGRGSYRDALGFLEQILTLNKGLSTTNSEIVSKYAGKPSSGLIFSLLKSICEKNITQLLADGVQLKGNGVSALKAYDELLELIRQGLLARVGEISHTLQADREELTLLTKKYPHTIGSKTILELLEKRHLLEVSPTHAWTALEAILLSLIEA